MCLSLECGHMSLYVFSLSRSPIVPSQCSLSFRAFSIFGRHLILLRIFYLLYQDQKEDYSFDGAFFLLEYYHLFDQSVSIS